MAIIIAGLLGGFVVYRTTGSANPPPIVLLDGVQLTPGVEQVPPHPLLTVALAHDQRITDFRASVDGHSLPIAPGKGGSVTTGELQLPLLSQGAWHHLQVWRPGLAGTRTDVESLDFRTADPLELAAGWLAQGTRLRVDVSASRPFADPGPLVSSLQDAGAIVVSAPAHLVATWQNVAPGQRVTFSAHPGLQSTQGSYLPAEFAPVFTVPVTGQLGKVDVSGLSPPTTTGLKLQVYYVPTAIGKADLALHLRQVNVLSPTFYSLSAAGELVTESMDSSVLEMARGAGVEVQPLVTNQGFDAADGHSLVADPALAGHAADALVAEARRRGYRGFQLDFENLAPADRSAFTTFANTVGGRLRSAGLAFTAAVVPRKGGGGSDLGAVILNQFSGVYDYPALSRSSDWLSLMAYDQHTRQTDPGPVAGIDWVEQIVTNSAAGIDHSHLYLGVPLYFRDWGQGSRPVSGPFFEAVDLAISHGGGLQWDFPTQSSFIRYNDGSADHVLWTDDATSLGAKIKLAQRLNFGGISAWRLGFEDPAFWDLWPAH